ncbi:PAS domain-containing protein [Flavisolibacter sp. BT320]|nr:PAS domain-containing protein [Flavisolibacter longurius]
MNLVLTEPHLVVSFFDQQPQPAFWMTPVFDHKNDVIDFEYRYCNQEFYRYTGISADSVIGNFVSTSPVISDPAARKRLFHELLDGYQNGYQTKAWIHNTFLNKYHSYTRNRVEGGVLTVLQDRTEEFEMTRQLEEQKRLMDNIMAQSSNAITVSEMIRDESGAIIDMKTLLVNEAAVRNTGIPKEVYLSKTASELDPNFVGSPYFALCVQCMETGEPVVTQYYLEGADRWMEVSVSRMDQEHQIYIFTDVTKIKQAQIRVEQAAERLEAVFNAAQSGMFIFSPVTNEQGEVTDFRFVITNPTFAAYVGQTPDVLRGELGSTFFPGYLHNGVFAMYKETYLTGNTLRKEVHYNVDQHDLYLDLMSSKVQDEVLVTFTDLTHVKKAQFELEKLVTELQQSNSKLEEFAHAASHDLKEPIRKVRVFAERLKASLADRMNEGEGVMFERMQNATERMMLLVDDLLTYSYVSMTGVEMEQVDLNEKLSVVLTDLEVAIQEKNARIDVGHLPVVRGYRRQLQQLFQNLVSNALKYSKPDVAPQIAITATTVKGKDAPGNVPSEKVYYLIEVKDNGIGFEQVYAERIFQMFQRLHGRTAYDGTGIGLAIARKVVENHHGSIWAESELEKGSSFKVLLPVD